MRNLNVVAVFLLCAGCAGQGTETQRLLRHFEKSGINGRYAWKKSSVGAVEAGSFNGNDFSAEIYLFPDEARAQAAQQAGIDGKFGTRNGRFILLVQRGEGYLLPAYQQFR